uniref:Uncharacterized protein n=1 Tax=Anguilla anguilla TaxID=7936 RepID=A0A0E9R4Y2_ANGAN
MPFTGLNSRGHAFGFELIFNFLLFDYRHLSQRCELMSSCSARIA